MMKSSSWFVPCPGVLRPCRGLHRESKHAERSASMLLFLLWAAPAYELP